MKELQFLSRLAENRLDLVFYMGHKAPDAYSGQFFWAIVFINNVKTFRAWVATKRTTTPSILNLDLFRAPPYEFPPTTPLGTPKEVRSGLRYLVENLEDEEEDALGCFSRMTFCSNIVYPDDKLCFRLGCGVKTFEWIKEEL